MKNPLRKRLLRNLRDDATKYLVVFILMVASIGFISGFLVADLSMIQAYNEGFEKYTIENGNFRLSKKLNVSQRNEIEKQDVQIYDNFYLEAELTNDSTLRIFKNRTEVNIVCLMDGEFPVTTGEIAIDRMYADNNGIKIGDQIGDGSKTWRVTGLVALPDYSCLFSDNNDSMFDAIKFGVAIVSDEEFSGFRSDRLVYSYSWLYDDPPEDENAEKEVSEDLMTVIQEEGELESFVPLYLNQAINFTGEDMGGDRLMMTALLYILILIMAFVFAITTTNTIQKEANVIGTLRASGYTKSELIRHYLAVPMMVTTVAALVGNILGYTVFKDICADMYYGSYSLPTYKTIWSGEAFFYTTVIPLIVMFLINYVLLKRSLQLSPLKFLRRDLSRRKRQRSFPLSPVLPFSQRFRIRVLLQNKSNYLMLLIGILFANLLLLFGMIFPSLLGSYQDTLEENLLSDYQYILQVPYDAMNENRKINSMISMFYFQHEVETDYENAEKFSVQSLETLGETFSAEQVMIYGVEPDSAYVSEVDFQGKTYISSAYAKKYLLEVGDRITLKETYGDEEYVFNVDGIYPYDGSISIFMERESMNKMFDFEETYFSGYFSDQKLTDIDEKYISTVIDIDELTKISRQLLVSMGGMMNLVQAFAVLMFLVLMYMLSRIILEKNAQSISMAKILGYKDVEIAGLYILPTSIFVVLFILLSLPIESFLLSVIYRLVLLDSLNGYIEFAVEPTINIRIFLLGFFSYLLIAIIEFRRIRKIPMDSALKNVE